MSKLFGLLRKVRPYNLIKVYAKLDESEWQLFIREVVAYFENAFLVDEGVYEVNYKEAKKYSLNLVAKDITRLTLNKFEMLFVGDEKREKCVSVNSYKAHSCGANLYQISFVFPVSFGLKETFIAALKAMDGCSHVVYGYGRELDDRYDPASENKIKKSLFGNLSVDVESVADQWIVSLSNMDGMVKGVYKINYVSKKALASDAISCLFDKGSSVFESSSHKLIVMNAEND